MTLGVLRTHEPTPLESGNQRLSDFAGVATAVVPERTLDQKAIAADFFHHFAHSHGDSFRRSDQVDRRAGAALRYQLPQRLAAARLLEFVERALLPGGRQFACK